MIPLHVKPMPVMPPESRYQPPAEKPFDPRREVSASAKRIVLNLWIIFVALPVAIGILYAIANSYH